jgi:hypothetical protein
VSFLSIVITIKSSHFVPRDGSKVKQYDCWNCGYAALAGGICNDMLRRERPGRLGSDTLSDHVRYAISFKP